MLIKNYLKIINLVQLLVVLIVAVLAQTGVAQSIQNKRIVPHYCLALAKPLEVSLENSTNRLKEIESYKVNPSEKRTQQMVVLSEVLESENEGKNLSDLLSCISSL